MSIDLRKAFDTVDHVALFSALRNHGVDDGYIALLQLLYRNQSGSVNGSKEFSIGRGVKQGDVLSAIIFNCVLDIAFEKWRARLHDQGLFWAFGLPRLTNTRYADDILLYARSLKDLVEMAEMLIEELKSIGLYLNSSKSKILTTETTELTHDANFIEVGDDYVEILLPDQFHRYLGRYVSLSREDRLDVEFRHRKQQAWHAYNKHRKCILNPHISLRRRLHYFDVCVTPTLLFALSVLPLHQSHLHALDVLQRKMLRRIIGWRMLRDESLKDTMSRMKHRFARAQYLYYAES